VLKPSPIPFRILMEVSEGECMRSTSAKPLSRSVPIKELTALTGVPPAASLRDPWIWLSFAAQRNVDTAVFGIPLKNGAGSMTIKRQPVPRS
jgi:hypothetical protein